MNTNKFVDLIGSDRITYRGIKRPDETISAYKTMVGLDKAKVTKYLYELEDGRIAEPNRFGEFQISGTNITLKPL